MLGLFIASLGLATAVAGSSLLAPTSQPDAAASRLRFWTIYLGLFGFIGAPLTLLQLAVPLPLAIAVGAAGVLSCVINPLFQEASAEIGLGRFVGSEGTVMLPVGAGRGRVVIHTLADRVELPARSDDGGRIERGARVLVAFIEDGVAAVVNLDPTKSSRR